MGNSTCCCKDDKQTQNRDSDMGFNSKRSTRRRENKEKRSSQNFKKETIYENKGHTTNIITTNAAILYNGDKAQELVREIMTSNIPPVKYPNLESEKNIYKPFQNEPEVPLGLSDDDQLPNNVSPKKNQNQEKAKEPSEKNSSKSIKKEPKPEIKNKKSSKLSSEAVVNQIVKKPSEKETKKKMSSNLGNGSKRKNQSIIHSIEKPSITQNATSLQAPTLTQPPQMEIQAHPEPEVNLKKEEVKAAPIVQKSPPVKEQPKEVKEENVKLGFSFDEENEEEQDKYGPKLATMFEKYSFKEYLGVSVYSEVRRVVNNFTQEAYALKIIKKSYINKDERKDLKIILSGLLTNENKNVTSLVEYFQDKKYYYLIYEYNHGGLLFDYIANSNYFNDKMVALTIKQILSAIIYNQGKEIFHKDIRPENLMVDDALIDIPTVKINDFSTAVEYNPKDKKVRKFRKMTFTCLYFIPPEIIENMGYNEKSDVWSVGLLILLLLTGNHLIKGMTNKQTLNNVKSKDLKINQLVADKIIDEDAGKLLNKMLARNPAERISPIEALNDPWMIKHSKSELINSSSLVNADKFIQFWNLYYLQNLCMGYFGIYSLDSLSQETLKKEALKLDIKESDSVTYDDLFKIYSETNDNSKTTIAFELDEILLDADYDEDSKTIKFDHFLKCMSKKKIKFCESQIKDRFEKCTAKTDGKMDCNVIRGLLIEREDSIIPNWTKCLKELSLSESSKVDFDTFLKLFKFRVLKYLINKNILLLIMPKCI